MKVSIYFLSAILLFINTIDVSAQKKKEFKSSTEVSINDFNSVLGDWKGSLTYIDYQTNKPYSMAANVNVKKGRMGDRIILYNTYPKEPKANNFDKIVVRKNGTYLNKSEVISRKTMDDGSIIISAQKTGKDNRKPAQLKYTYLISEDRFSIRKEVKFESSDSWIKRSEFDYKKRK